MRNHRIGGAEAIPFVEDFERSAHNNGEAAFMKLADMARLAIPDLRIRTAKEIIDRKVAEVEARRPLDQARIAQLGRCP